MRHMETTVMTRRPSMRHSVSPEIRCNNTSTFYLDLNPDIFTLVRGGKCSSSSSWP